MILLSAKALVVTTSMGQMKKPMIADAIRPMTPPIPAKYAVGSVYRAILPMEESMGQKMPFFSLVFRVLRLILAITVARMQTAASVSIPPCISTSTECTAIRSTIPKPPPKDCKQDLY